MKGKLVTFEGIEGCGKSTQLRLLSAWLTTRGVAHTCTREPGGTEVGVRIREILLSEKTHRLEPVSEVLLYLADRFQHIGAFLRPRLEAGELVLSDRYHDSTVAYQGYARGLSKEWIDQLWSGSGMALHPDLTIVFDVSPEIGIARSLRKLQHQALDESRFERESLEFHGRVRAGFLDLALKDPSRFRVLDAGGSEQEIHGRVLEVIEPFLKEHFQR